MADKTTVKTPEKPDENPQDKPAELKDISRPSAEFPPHVRELMAAEEREEKDVILTTRTALENLSAALPPQKPSPDQRLEKFTA